MTLKRVILSGIIASAAISSLTFASFAAPVVTKEQHSTNTSKASASAEVAKKKVVKTSHSSVAMHHGKHTAKKGDSAFSKMTQETTTQYTEQKDDEGLTVKVGGTADIMYGASFNRREFKNETALKNTVFGTDNDGSLTYGKSLLSGVDSETDQRWGQIRGISANNSKFNLQVSNKTLDGMEYGGVMEMRVDSGKGGDGVATKRLFIYAKDKWGKVEFGQVDGPTHTMQVDASNIAKATGGIDGNWGDIMLYGIVGHNAATIPAAAGSEVRIFDLNKIGVNSPSLPASNEFIRKSNKITYYTPEFNGFSAGIGYVPNSNAKGGIGSHAKAADGNGAYKDVFQAALKYNYESANGIGFETSIVGEAGKAMKAFGKNEYQDKFGTYDAKLNNLAAYEVGAKISANGFAFVASYADAGKSGGVKSLSKTISSIKSDVDVTGIKKRSKYWTVGASYDYKDFGVSLTYFEGKRAGSLLEQVYAETTNPGVKYSGTTKTKVVSLGAEYKVAPGFKPYAEVSYVKFKSPLPQTLAAKGTVLAIGTKITF